jgi:predicted dinucleotide-binding enzyme
MYNQASLGTATLENSGSRIYRMEVSGLRQNAATSSQQYAIRRSGTVVLTVPYSRMSDEMQRINRLGGKIVKIEAVDGAAPAPASEPAASEE